MACLWSLSWLMTESGPEPDLEPECSVSLSTTLWLELCPCASLGREKGRLDYKWKGRKIQGERAWSFGFCNEVAYYSLASLEYQWEAVLNFSASPCDLYSFTLI